MSPVAGGTLLDSDTSPDRIAPNFTREAFAGTAGYYSRFRPPYPPVLLSDLLTRAEVPAGGRLLDLGCGPGRIALPLQDRLGEIWAVDPEPEMLAEGRRIAGPSRSIRWIESTAEQLVAPLGQFDLITAGESFHRFDQRVVGAKALGWLRPGHCLALLWQVNLWPGDEEWQKSARGIVSRYVDMRSASSPPPGIGQFATFQEALASIGFLDISTHEFQAIHEWTVESMLGYLYSTSILSRRVLGDRRSAFEADFKGALARLGGNGVFQESIRFGYALGRRA